jgi:hypothetical protein
MGSSSRRNSTRRKPAANRPKRHVRRRRLRRTAPPDIHAILKPFGTAIALVRCIRNSVREQDIGYDEEIALGVALKALDNVYDMVDMADLQLRSALTGPIRKD